MDRRHLDSAATYGVDVATFFCPNGVAEGNWRLDFNVNFAVIDYVLCIKGTPRLQSTNRNLKIYPQPINSRGGSYLPRASERELAADTVMSTTPNSETASFSQIFGGGQLPHHTSHLDRIRPDGGNILFLDGSVAWRDFGDPMTVRTIGAPSYWF